MTPPPPSGHSRKAPNAHIRPLQPQDFEAVHQMGLQIYPKDDPWHEEYFWSHLEMFPQGQLVAVDNNTGQVLGYAASLIVNWDDYEFEDSWNTFTDTGYFTNHDPEHGKTLYGADLMVDPATQGRGIGKLIYKAREHSSMTWACGGSGPGRDWPATTAMRISCRPGTTCSR